MITRFYQQQCVNRSFAHTHLHRMLLLQALIHWFRVESVKGLPFCITALGVPGVEHR